MQNIIRLDNAGGFTAITTVRIQAWDAGYILCYCCQFVLSY